MPGVALIAAEGMNLLYRLPPEMLGTAIRAVEEELLAHERKVSPAAALYVQKQGGFQCRTCRYALALNATHGKCTVMTGTIHLDDGCCVMWQADPAQLHLYQEPSTP